MDLEHDIRIVPYPVTGREADQLVAGPHEGVFPVNRVMGVGELDAVAHRLGALALPAVDQDGLLDLRMRFHELGQGLVAGDLVA